jgi:hypothetical protein
VVETPCDVKSNVDLTLGNQFSALKRCARVKLRPFPKTRKKGIVPRADSVRKSADHAIGTRALQDLDIFVCVKPEEGRLGCGRGFNQFSLRKGVKIVCSAKVVGETQPFYLERVTLPIVIFKILISIEKSGFHAEFYFF